MHNFSSFGGKMQHPPGRLPVPWLDIFFPGSYNDPKFLAERSVFMNRTLLRTAFLDTVPVMTGYLCLGFGFGIVMQQNGLGLLWALALSLFVYAGSMQYVAVGLLASGAGLLTAALTTLAVNARHLFYGLSMIDAYKDMGKKKKLHATKSIVDFADERIVSFEELEPEERIYCSMLSNLLLGAALLIISLIAGAV